MAKAKRKTAQSKNHRFQQPEDKPVFCEGCELYEKNRIRPQPTYQVDLLVIGPAPMPDDVKRSHFQTGAGKIFRNMINQMQKHIPKAEQARIEYSYAVECCPGPEKKFKPSAAAIKSCTGRLMNDVKRFNPKVILLLGRDTLRSFGFAGKLKDYRGNVYEQNRFGIQRFIVPTFSPAQMKKNPGITETFRKDIQKALTCTHQEMEEDSFDLRCPTDCKSILAELDEMEKDISVYGDHADAKARVVGISMDTETTSLKPWDERQRMIAASLCWNAEAGKGLAFPIDHKACKLTIEERETICQRLTKVLGDPKIKLIMHNAKFDDQWVNHAYELNIPRAAWDTLLMEHQLDEDKKGEYSLKQLTRDYYPGAGKYEDELQEWIRKAEAEKKQQHKKQSKKYKEKLFAYLVDFWTSIEEDERVRWISRWVRKGFIQEYHPTVIQLERRKPTKKMEEAGETPPLYKRCIDRIGKTLQVVPLAELPSEIERETKRYLPDSKLLEPVTFEDVPLDVMLKYAAIDAVMTQRIAGKQKDRLKQEGMKEYETSRRVEPGFFDKMKGIGWANANITMPMSEIVSDMEYHGVRLDRDKARRYRDHLAEKAEKTKDAMMHHLGYEFNPQAPEDLIQILYEDMKLPKIKMTEKGDAPSTDAATLLNLYDQTENEFLKQMLFYRKLEKCKSTYLDGWLERSAIDGRIHASFNQNGTATHRLSSSNPNLQNVMFYLKGVADPDNPKKDMNLKSLFLPDDLDHEIYDLDISNAEMRILCAYSLDPTLIGAFLNGMDMHCLTGEGISEYSYETMKAYKEEKESHQFLIRQVAKAVNFGKCLPNQNTLNCWKPKSGNGYGNQQPGRAGMPVNGSETDRPAGPVGTTVVCA